jgi:CO/xanthine dehydrogenase FAD-binding subunit
MEDIVFDHIRAFHQPCTADEAIRLLQKPGGQACLVAGGTDLALRTGRSVTDLVDITRLGLDYIRRSGQGVRIGASTTLTALEQSPRVRHLANGILAMAAASCGTLQTRNLSTIGGTLANASSAADLATPLLVLAAKVVLQGLRSRRQVLLAEFFQGPHDTVATGSLLTEIAIPPCLPHTAWSFQRFSRTGTDIALVNVGAGLQLSRRGRCTWIRIAFGAAAPRPMRAPKAEAVLADSILNKPRIERAADVAAQEILPITDVRATAEYRTELIRVLLRRALEECAEHLEGAL